MGVGEGVESYEGGAGEEDGGTGVSGWESGGWRRVCEVCLSGWALCEVKSEKFGMH